MNQNPTQSEINAMNDTEFTKYIFYLLTVCITGGFWIVLCQFY